MNGTTTVDTGDFDFTASTLIFDSDKARANWNTFCEHAVSEWKCDIDATMATMVADNPFQIFYGTGFEVHGYKEVRDFYIERMKTFQGQGFYSKQWIVTDDVITGRGWFKGLPNGPFFGAMTHGKPLFLPFALWVHFDNNSKIIGESAYFDGKELLRQIEEGQEGDVRKSLS